MNVSWFFCFTFLLLKHTVLGQSDTIEGTVGQTVLLPCSLEQKPKNVRWRYRDSRNVCDITGGKVTFSEQDPAYSGRVNISESEIAKKNFSISLSNVKESDAGPYTCYAPSIDYIKTIELTVKAAEKQITTVREVTQNPTTQTTSKNSESRIRADRLLAFLLGCALLYNLVF